MKNIISVILLTISINLSAQINDVYNNFLLHKIDSSQKRISIGVNSYFSSNSIKTNFFNKLLTNNYIDNEVKSINNILPENYFISENTNRISYIVKPDSFASHTDIGFKFDVVNVNLITSKFTDDLYNVAFYGNKKFAGKTADFSDSYYNSISYQKINFGFFKHDSNSDDNNKITYYAAFSLINGQDNKSIYLRNSNLYTSETGEYIDFDMQMDYYYAKDGKTNFMENRGIGGAFNFNLTYENTKSNYFVNLSIENLGIIKWNKYSNLTQIDSSFHFEGIDIPNILDYTNYTTSELTKDSLMSVVTSGTLKKAYITRLNEKLNLSFSKNLINNNLFTTVGIGYLYNVKQPLPIFYGNTNYRFNKFISSYLQLSYGGFTKFQYGLGITLNFKKFDVLIASNNLPGFVLSELSYSQSIFIRLGYNFY